MTKQLFIAALLVCTLGCAHRHIVVPAKAPIADKRAHIIHAYHDCVEGPIDFPSQTVNLTCRLDKEEQIIR